MMKTDQDGEGGVQLGSTYTSNNTGARTPSSTRVSFAENTGSGAGNGTGMPQQPSTLPSRTVSSNSNNGPSRSGTGVGTTSVRESFTLNDVLGNHQLVHGGGASRTDGPTEHEVVTKILKSVETIDLNEDQPQLDAETTALLADIIEDDVAARTSSTKTDPNRGDQHVVDPELVPLTATSTTPHNHMSVTTAASGKSHNTTTTMENKRLNKKMMLHRKTESVEAQLFGLTAALANMDSRTSSRRGSSSENFLIDGGSDRLTKTANVLSDHAKKEAELEADLEAANNNNNGNGGGDNAVADQGPEQPQNNNNNNNHPPLLGGMLNMKMSHEMEDNWDVFKEFLESRTESRKKFAKKLGLYLMLPCLFLAILLYYGFDTPKVENRYQVQVEGNTTSTKPPSASNNANQGQASISWWFLYIIRLSVTYTMALGTQSFVIDYVVLRTRTLLKWLGPIVTLLFVQARGWPFIATFWGLYNLILNAGSSDFANNWLYWQDTVEVFSYKNPSGGFPGSRTNYLFIALFIIVGVCVSLKRVLLSLSLGKQTFAHFGDELAVNMKNMVIIGSIAALAKRIEREHRMTAEEPSSTDLGAAPITGGGKGPGDDTGSKLMAFVEEEVGANEKVSDRDTNAVDAAKTFIANHTTVKPIHDNENEDGSEAAPDLDLTQSMYIQLNELLEEWEEPEGAKAKTTKKITIGSVLQFRQSMTLMSAKYPFSPAFGIADTREACVKAAQEVYDRLMLRTPDRAELPFETLALIAKDGEHDFNEERAKELIKIFRPDRAGNLSKLNFVRSVDDVYKSIRLLTANISNSRHTDAAVESIINGIFWFFIVTFVMQELGMDPWALLVSLSTVFISLSFMFGSTAAKFIDGMLFVLLQRPYGVGDRIHFSNPDADTSINGSSGWIVEELTLHTTTVYWGATNERATISNGALSNYRVINSARSPNAVVYVNMKFAIETPYEKIETFRAATEQFLKDRPREWVGFVGFRPTEVAPDRGYINYVTIAQHRQSWQNVGQILASKAGLVKFLMEVAKQLDMRYSSPPLPVDLSIQGHTEGELTPSNLLGMIESVGLK